MGGSEERSSPPAPTVLAPGFRFHPTDEELVWYYLRRKVSAKRLRLDVISEIDIYKFEPTDLPGLSLLKSRDREWYFFSALDRKYGNGVRTNRATEQGYWKTTGKDRLVYHKDRHVGMKKTLVYHFGRAPHGKRTDWVMHEYKLLDDVLDAPQYPLQGYVLCRVFQKSGSGPKNGEQYGANFLEEEWEDNEPVSAAAPSGCVLFEDPYGDDDANVNAKANASVNPNANASANANAFIEQNDLLQVVDQQLAQSVPSTDNFDNQASQNYVEGCRDMIGTDEKPSVGHDEYVRGLQALDYQMVCDVVNAGSSTNVVKNEYINAPNDECNEPPLCLDELFPSDVGNAPLDEGLYFDAADWDSAGTGSIFDDDVDITTYLNFDYPPEPIDGIAGLGSPAMQNLDDALWQLPSASELLPGPSNDGLGSSATQDLDVPVDKLSKTAPSKGNYWLDIPAQPAFASETPTKDMVSRLSAAVQSSSAAHVTAGMIRIRDMQMARGSGLQWSFDKMGNVNILLSFDVSQTVSPAELESLTGIFSSKFAAAASRSWMYSMFFWVFVLALSLKVGACIYAK